MPKRRTTAASTRVLWIVAIAGMVQAVLSAFDAALQGSSGRFWLWMGGSLPIGALAGWAETVKQKRRH